MRYVDGRIILKIDPEQKNKHRFSDGTEIYMGRQFDNFDRSYTQQVLGECVSAEHIPTGAMVLYHFNAAHDSNVVFDHKLLSSDEIARGCKIISVLENEVYLWKMQGEKEWKPTKGFVISERVFKPYEGIVTGIEPSKIPNVLYIKTGELKGNIVHTLKACDYSIKFVNEDGILEEIVRCRHFENEEHEREEILAISYELTEKLYKGKLLIGINSSNCTTLKTQIERV